MTDSPTPLSDDELERAHQCIAAGYAPLTLAQRLLATISHLKSLSLTASTVDFLCNVLADAARQFRFYEQSHSRKGTPDGDEKAMTNAAHALACEAAVAMARDGTPPPVAKTGGQ